MPDSITLRQVEVEIEDRDGSTKMLTLVTTITDPAVPDSEIADLYRQRWNCELDFRSIKSDMQMDILRTKTPSMARKEIFCHLLAYNLPNILNPSIDQIAPAVSGGLALCTSTAQAAGTCFRTTDQGYPDGLTVDEEAVERSEPGSLEPGAPGAVRDLTVQLKPGRYILFCNMEGHYMAGMHTELVVR